MEIDWTFVPMGCFMCVSICLSSWQMEYQEPQGSEKMQKRAARFADMLLASNKKSRAEPLTLQINSYVVSMAGDLKYINSRLCV